ncbi:MAG: YjjI family glycine radical enzyme [Marivita sp.]|uniref:YjjI family glycine radical enzyme n=1 Tax=Marivita sp. TaxID=2003365 RepID=UPI0025BAEA8F|nr:YjjI family glycine radical enzyme [Marivita sp.]MCI5109768.1 YjjI family glycine radical enzyme [Marivita sp.]
MSDMKTGQIETPLAEQFATIINNATLSPRQKTYFLARTAENSLEYAPLDADVQAALNDRVICDMYEGNAPYKPRYVLPDYAVVLRDGSEYLELPAPRTLDEAINTLMIAYHHIPSVTGMPVYIGQLDDLLLPFCDGVSDEDLHAKMRLFWRFLDRTLPDAFMHANIGPSDNRVARAVLAVDAELNQVAPNLTFRYDPAVSSDEILRICTDNILSCSKPHIANHPIHAAVFDDPGYGIVSCYNALPLGGGSATLCRMNLAEVATRSDSEAAFFSVELPRYVAQLARLIEARVERLDASGFYDSFLVEEGWISRERFGAMFGIYAMAEAVNRLQDLEGRKGRYGHDEGANALGVRISQALSELVAATPIAGIWTGRAMLHSQSGISTDIGYTPGVRIPYGSEPDPVAHVQALRGHHAFYTSGVSDILTLDETVRANPAAVFQLAKGALALGFREFTANVAGNDLVRVTGYMIRLSDLERHKQDKELRHGSSLLGAEAAESAKILTRRPRVVAVEMQAGETAMANA